MPSTWPRRCLTAARRQGFAEWRCRPAPGPLWPRSYPGGGLHQRQPGVRDCRPRRPALGTADHGGRRWGLQPRRPTLGTTAVGVGNCSRGGRRRGVQPRRPALRSADQGGGDGGNFSPTLARYEPANFSLTFFDLIF
jgi:hypothetical protein